MALGKRAWRQKERAWRSAMLKQEYSIITSILQCPVDYFIPFCCLDDILKSCTLSLGQCGILTMIDTPILAIFRREKIFENMEKSLHNIGFVSIHDMWNTDDDRNSG